MKLCDGTQVATPAEERDKTAWEELNAKATFYLTIAMEFNQSTDVGETDEMAKVMCGTV